MNLGRIMMAAAVLLGASPALAQPVVIADSGDSAWVLAASALVLLAVAGLARGSRALPAALAAALLAWMVIGYSLAFSEGSNILGGTGNALLGNLADLRPETTISESGFVLFHTALALFAATLALTGAAARGRSGWLVALAPLWLLVVYAPVARWVGGGWLSELGALDYGGGIALMTSAGASAFALAALLGRGEAGASRGSPALIVIGWFGIAGGAALAAGDDAASAILAVLASGAAGALAGAALSRRVDGAVPGGLAGLAAGSAAAGFAGMGGALLLGVGGGVAAWGAAAGLARLRLTGAWDEAVMIGGGGAVGALLLPLTGLPVLGGPGLEDGVTIGSLFIAQGVAVLAVALWSLALTAILALMVSMVLPMRERVP